MPSILKSKYLLWLILLLPGILMTRGLLTGDTTYDMYLHATGEFSARFLIITLIATPLAILFPGKSVPLWLVRNRRYFGVVAFIYALFHTGYYLYHESLQKALGEFFEWGLLTGWIAFLIFVPLAITSNDASVRYMKQRWKKLQRWVYLAAIATLLHWMLIHYHFIPAMVHFAPVALLQILRISKNK